MPVEFHVGQMLEITEEERRVLEGLSDQMWHDAKSRHTGWFKAYLEGHRHAHGIIKGIFKRSHASS